MNTSENRLQIQEAGSAHILVNAAPGQYAKIEGNWYVAPEAVDKTHLRISDQEYRCPYKGRCLYVDFDDGVRRVSRVAWLYDDVLSGWEHIKGTYGFYSGPVAQKLGKTEDELC